MRERASSRRRRRRRSPADLAGVTTTPTSVSHPLNFHLNGSAGFHSGASDPSADNKREELSPALPAAGAAELENERRASEGDDAGAGQDGRRTSGERVEGLGGDREGGGIGHDDGELVGNGCGISGNEERADGQANGRRLSTLAR